MNDNAKKWIAALRSGKYTQDVKRLKTEKGHCCLGVLCEVAMENGEPWYPGVSREYETIEDCCGLPENMKDWAGLRDTMGRVSCGRQPTLTSLNDSLGFTFEMIADHLEKYEELYFVSDKEE